MPTTTTPILYLISQITHAFEFVVSVKQAQKWGKLTSFDFVVRSMTSPASVWLSSTSCTHSILAMLLQRWGTRTRGQSSQDMDWAWNKVLDSCTCHPSLLFLLFCIIPGDASEMDYSSISLKLSCARDQRDDTISVAPHCDLDNLVCLFMLKNPKTWICAPACSRWWLNSASCSDGNFTSCRRKSRTDKQLLLQMATVPGHRGSEGWGFDSLATRCSEWVLYYYWDFQIICHHSWICNLNSRPTMHACFQHWASVAPHS